MHVHEIYYAVGIHVHTYGIITVEWNAQKNIVLHEQIYSMFCVFRHMYQYILSYYKVHILLKYLIIFMSLDRMIGGILFLFCLSVVNFKLCYNFWHSCIRDRDFTFGVFTPLMTSFQMIPKSMTLTVTYKLNISFSDFVVTGA